MTRQNPFRPPESEKRRLVHEHERPGPGLPVGDAYEQGGLQYPLLESPSRDLREHTQKIGGGYHPIGRGLFLSQLNQSQVKCAVGWGKFVKEPG